MTPPARWKPRSKKEWALYREWKAFCIRGALRTRRLYVWRKIQAEAWEQWDDEQYTRFSEQLKALQYHTNSMASTINYPQLFELPEHDKRLVRQLARIELNARLLRAFLLRKINTHG